MSTSEISNEFAEMGTEELKRRYERLNRNQSYLRESIDREEDLIQTIENDPQEVVDEDISEINNLLDDVVERHSSEDENMTMYEMLTQKKNKLQDRGVEMKKNELSSRKERLSSDKNRKADMDKRLQSMKTELESRGVEL